MSNATKQFEHFLNSKSLKLTFERKTLLQYITGYKGHFTAEDLTKEFKQQNFRNLPLLLEAGIIQKSVGVGKSDYYEFMPSIEKHHDHMICLNCHAVFEFFSPTIEQKQLDICRTFGFKLSHHDHRLFGYCKNCH